VDFANTDFVQDGTIIEHEIQDHPPDESYSLDGTMTGSMPCDMGCLPEISPERKKKAPVKLFKRVAKSFLRESESDPPHIHLQVVKIFINRATPQDMLAVVFEATV
jgi:hypothetical protein